MTLPGAGGAAGTIWAPPCRHSVVGASVAGGDHLQPGLLGLIHGGWDGRVHDHVFITLRTKSGGIYVVHCPVAQLASTVLRCIKNLFGVRPRL